jgi:hypothetical protein
MGLVAIWTEPITTAINFLQASFRTAIDTGDLIYACYSIDLTVRHLLVRNDPLDAVWREAARSLDFVRKAKHGHVADSIVSLQRFIAAMQGRTARLSTYSDAEFDEAAFEEHLRSTEVPRRSVFIGF